MLSQLNKFAKWVLPDALIRSVSIHRSLPPPARSVYLSLAIRRALNLWPQTRREIPPGTRAVLFVCHGNIIRSPMAATLMQQRLDSQTGPGIVVFSAGLHAEQGKGADADAIVMAREFGISLANHRTQPLTPELVSQMDAIFVMDLRNAAELIARFPEARPKVFMLGAFAGNEPGIRIEIDDPLGRGRAELRRCYKIIQSAVGNLATVLSSPDRGLKGSVRKAG